MCWKTRVFSGIDQSIKKQSPIIDGSPTFEKLKEKPKKYFRIGTCFKEFFWRKQSYWSFDFEESLT